MHPGDFIITPSWTWHDHGNESGNPVIWLDGLDIPTVRMLDSGFAENYAAAQQKVVRAEGSNFARFGTNMAPMAHDADYLVRQRVAERLPHGRLARMAHDPEREVRKVVARRLPPFALTRMVDDEAPEVRRIVASRLLSGEVARLLHDPDWLVRLEVVRRAPVEDIAELVNDPEADVRSRVRARLEGFLLEDES